MLCGGTSCICYGSSQHCLWSPHMRNVSLPGSLPLLYVCLVELLLLPESECQNLAFSEIPDMWVTAIVSRKTEKCWIHWLLLTPLLTMQCCSFWHTAALHNTSFFFSSFLWKRIIVLMGLCVTAASFTVAQSSLPRDTELLEYWVSDRFWICLGIYHLHGAIVLCNKFSLSTCL